MARLHGAISHDLVILDRIVDMIAEILCSVHCLRHDFLCYENVYDVKIMCKMMRSCDIAPCKPAISPIH